MDRKAHKLAKKQIENEDRRAKLLDEYRRITRYVDDAWAKQLPIEMPELDLKGYIKWRMWKHPETRIQKVLVTTGITYAALIGAIVLDHYGILDPDSSIGTSTYILTVLGAFISSLALMVSISLNAMDSSWGTLDLRFYMKEYYLRTTEKRIEAAYDTILKEKGSVSFPEESTSGDLSVKELEEFL